MCGMAKSLTVKRLLVLAALCVVAYAPALNLPLMEDDYPNIAQALDFGSPVAPLLNPIFRARATSYWAMGTLYRGFHVAPLPYHALSLLLHIANTWLVYFGLLAWPRTRAAAIWAGGFFAVHEGHQEAVMWFSAINELLQFLFGGLAILLWMHGKRWIALSVVCFALALVSKESAVIFPLLFLFASVGRPEASRRWTLILYVALEGLAVAAIAETRAYSFRFSDGSFSFAAPFWITWPRGIARLMWIWGWVAAGILVLYRRKIESCKTALAAVAWIGIGLLPYSFLTYSTQIPSRQTYLASAVLAALFGLAMAHLVAEGGRVRTLALALALIALAHNVGYLWIRKVPQFTARAQPTEQLVRMARETGGPIWMQCFPLARITAEAAAQLGAGLPPEKLIWRPADARNAKATFCYLARR